MKSRLLLALLVVLMALLSRPAFASTLKDYYDTGDNTENAISYFSGGTDYWMAMTFAATTSYSIESVALKLFKTYGPGLTYISIKGTSGGVPVGDDLVTKTIAGSSLPTSAAWVTIPFDTSYPLISGTTYAVVLRTTDYYVNWRINNATHDYAGGSVYLCSDGGSTWNIQNADAMFRTYGPDPVSPVVATTAPSGITSSTCTFNGSLTDLGTAASVNVYFEYGIVGRATYTTPAASKAAPSTFAANLTGLGKSVSYRVRAVAVGDGTVYGTYMNFKMLGSGCFIATCVYGEDSEEVKVLREFRDERLLTSWLGTKLVELYYYTAPSVVDFLEVHTGLKRTVRVLLDGVVRVVELVGEGGQFGQ